MLTAPILLDVSRLLARARHGTPTGIDRVEHAYAEQLLALAPHRLRFVGIDRLGRLCQMPATRTRRFIADLGRHWAEAGRGSPAAEIGAAARRVWMEATLLRPFLGLDASERRPFYLLLSHRHLHRVDRLRRVLHGARARLVAFVHDLIPIEHPEFSRPLQAELHAARMHTVAALAEAVIVNSRATGGSLQAFLRDAGRTPPMLVVAPLGVGPAVCPATASASQPYFIAVGTIEPRKNHLLLLQAWRRLAERLGDAAPRLVLVGRRGWENENVIDHLDRAPAVRRLVTERAAVPDAELHALLRGSRALLFPSFAEGYGLPLAEALAAGVPALCSDIPALREVGGDVPDYLDPLDGLGWLHAIEAYAAHGSPARAQQMLRLASWTAPAWPDHLRHVLDALDRLPEPPPVPAALSRLWSGLATTRLWPPGLPSR